MRGLGVALLVFGIGSFILPLIGMQFRLLSIFGEGSQPIVGVVLAVIGAVLIFVSMTRGQGQAVQPSQPPKE
jgi:putative Mn2+ efflux pump MntP